MDQTVLTNLGWQLAGYVLTVGLAVGIPYAVRLLRAHIAVKQWEAVSHVAGDAVGAAFQYMQTADGQAKKAWVLGIVQAFMDTHHIRLDAASVDAQIENQVRDQKGWANIVANNLPISVSAGTTMTMIAPLAPAPAPK